MIRRGFAMVAVAFLAGACGGGGNSGGTTGPSAPTPAPAGTNAMSGVVFYDQNANGTLDGAEHVRFPGVRITVAGRSGTTDARGQFEVTGLPSGAQPLAIDTDSLPPYYQPGPLPSVTLPLASGAPVAVPVALPIRTNHPNRYLAFGDSITEGTGSVRKQGWATPLEERLRAYYGEAEVVVDGIRASRSIDGVQRMPASLADARPAFTLILYGVNDWNRCQSQSVEACYTVGALRDMIRIARGAGSQPVVGTIVPSNPASSLTHPDRNRWTQAENELIRRMVQEEGAVLAETWAAFGSDPNVWPSLFFDQNHPNDEGYARISDAFLQAITRARGAR
jgi:lysophospholipase L1-like esterase